MDMPNAKSKVTTYSSHRYMPRRIQGSYFLNGSFRQFGIPVTFTFRGNGNSFLFRKRCLAPLIHHILHIVGMRSEKQVVWTNATWIIAMVTDAHAFWNRPVRTLPCSAMREIWAALDTIHCCFPVSMPVFESCPKPALSRLIGMPFQTLLHRHPPIISAEDAASMSCDEAFLGSSQCSASTFARLTRRLPCANCGKHLRPPIPVSFPRLADILCPSTNPKMISAHARWNITGVENDHALRNRSNLKLISDAMRWYGPIPSAIFGKRTMTRFGFRSEPQPASVFIRTVHLLPKSVGRLASRVRRLKSSYYMAFHESILCLFTAPTFARRHFTAPFAYPVITLS